MIDPGSCTVESLSHYAVDRSIQAAFIFTMKLGHRSIFTMGWVNKKHITLSGVGQ